MIGKEFSPSEQYAAKELQRFVEEICGVRLNISYDGGPVTKPKIILGDSVIMREIAPHLNLHELGEEGYIIQTRGSSLILAGSRKRGTLYAVYGFLEDYLNCHWYTSEVWSIPKRSEIICKDLNERKIPILNYREPRIPEALDGDWYARNRMNSSYAYLESKHGGKIVYERFVHTFYKLVAPSKYFQTYPEYFSMLNGKRTCDQA